MLTWADGQERDEAMTDQWTLFDAGMWLMFLVWGVAWHLCHDDGVDGLGVDGLDPD